MGQDIDLVGEDDKVDITTLFLTSDPRHQRSVAYYEYSNTTPFGDAINVVAKDDDKIIGHYSIVPLKFKYFGKIINVGYAQQAIIHKDFRNLQLISDLHDYVIDIAKDKFDFVFAFSNDNFFKIKKNLFKWNDLGSFNADIIDLNDFDFDINHNVVEINSFKSSIKTSDNLISIEKNQDYLNYRYFLHPINHYKVFAILDDDKFSGYLSIKFYKKDDELIGHFIDYEAESEYILKSLITKTKEYFNFYGVSRVIFWNMSSFRDFFEPYITEKSFKTNFLVYDFSANLEILNKDKWNLSMILSDAF